MRRLVIFILIIFVYLCTGLAMANNRFIQLILPRIDKSLYQGYADTTSITLSENLIVGASYYIETSGTNGTEQCDNQINNGPWFIFTYTGIGQTHSVAGRCGSYGVAETMTASAANYLTTTTGYSYNVGFLKVIKLK